MPNDSPHTSKRAAEQSAAPATVTVISATNTPFVGKCYSLAHGKITNIPAADITSGSAKTIEAPTAESLRQIIESLTPSDIITLGSLKNTEIGVSRTLTTLDKPISGAVTRTLECIHYVPGRGWLLLDLDVGKAPQRVLDRIDELGSIRKAVSHCWPEIRTVTKVIRFSSSSGLVMPDGTSGPAKANQHVFVLIEDVSQSKEFLKRLDARAWEEGLGWMMITASGAMVPRSIFDFSVGSPERLVFVTPPMLKDGITRQARPIEIMNGEIAVMPDSRDPQLSLDLQQGERRRTAPEARKVREAFIDRQADKVVARQPKLTHAQAREIIVKRIDGQLLEDDDILVTHQGEISVRDLLKLNQHKMQLADPVEGPSYGIGKATYLSGDGRDPVIVSHAHGIVTTYRFAWFERQTARPVLRLPEHPNPKVTDTADEAALIIRRTLPSFFDGVLRGTVPTDLYAADMGIGKTRETIGSLVKFCMENPRHRVLVRVPTHILADQWVADISKASTIKGHPVAVGVFRGSSHIRPNGVPMCQRLDDVALVQRAGGSMSDVCGSSVVGYCQHHPDNGGNCLYRSQDLTTAQVVLVAGDVSLTRKLPKAIHRSGLTQEGTEAYERHFNAVIIDETAPSEMIVGGGMVDPANRIEIGIDLLAPAGSFGPACGKNVDAMERADLATSFAIIRDMLASKAATRWLTARDVRAMGYTASDVANLQRIVWMFKPDKPGKGASLISGQLLEAKLARAIDVNRDVRAVAHLLTALEQAIRDMDPNCPPDTELAHLLMRAAGGKSGTRVVANVAYRVKLANFMENMPTLILDATAQIDLLKRWFPTLQLACEARAIDGPGVLRIQVVGDGWTYSSSVHNEKRGNEKSSGDRMTRAAGWALFTAMQVGGQPGFVGPKAAVEAATAAGLMDGMVTGHFGALRGVNAFENSGSLVVYSRPLPNTEVVERVGAVISGKPVIPRVTGAMPTREREIEVEGGYAVATEERYHPCPEADRVVEATSRSERQQAEARSRAVRRGVTCPVVITVLGDGPIGRLVHHVASYGEWQAATHPVAFTFTLAGVWPLTRGRPEVIEAVAVWADRAAVDVGSVALGNVAVEEGALNGDISYRTLLANDAVDGSQWRHFLKQSTKTTATMTWKNQLFRHPELADLVKHIDEAFRTGALARLLTVPVSTAAYHPVNIRRRGSRYATLTMVRAKTPGAAIDRVRLMLPDADVSPADQDFAKWRSQRRTRNTP